MMQGRFQQCFILARSEEYLREFFTFKTTNYPEISRHHIFPSFLLQTHKKSHMYN